MRVSVEISYYPLDREFIPPIKSFISTLHGHEGILVRTSTMSTQVIGDYDQVMDLLKDSMKAAMELPHSVFVMKVINADLT